MILPLNAEISRPLGPIYRDYCDICGTRFTDMDLRRIEHETRPKAGGDFDGLFLRYKGDYYFFVRFDETKCPHGEFCYDEDHLIKYDSYRFKAFNIFDIPRNLEIESYSGISRSGIGQKVILDIVANMNTIEVSRDDISRLNEYLKTEKGRIQFPRPAAFKSLSDILG